MKFLKRYLEKNNNIQQDFEYYLESFPIDGHFPSPPLREYNFFGEIKKSKKRMKEWNLRIDEMDINWIKDLKNNKKEFDKIKSILERKSF